MDTSAEAGDAGRLVLLAGCCSRCGDDGGCGSSSCSACLLLLGWSVAAPEGPGEGPPPGTRTEAGTAMEWDRWRGMESAELDLASAPLLLLQLAATSKASVEAPGRVFSRQALHTCWSVEWPNPNSNEH